MYCTNCGTLNKDDAKFCVNCSESLSDVQIEERLTRSRALNDVSDLKKIDLLHALFDFSFNQLISLRITKWLFVFSIFAASLIAFLLVIAGFQTSKTFGFFSLLIGAPLIIILVVIYSRILLETMLAVSRISGHMAKLRVPKTEEKSQPGDNIQWNV